MRDFHLPGRSPVYATHGMAATSMPAATLDRARCAARRRQCAGRRGGRVRRAVRDRAAVDRHRRRLLLPLCAGRRRQGHRAERLGPRAGRRHDRLVREPADHGAREHLGARRHRARRDQRLGDAAEGAWPQGPRRTAAAGDPLRRRRLAGAPEGRPGTGSALEAKLRKNGAHAFLPSGAAPNAGDIFRSPPWPRRCARSPAHGAKAFYEGAVAADMVATLRARGGLHTEEDFAAGLHNAEFVEPITLNWNGYDVYQCPPNGQGIIVLMILGMLGGLPSAPDGPLGRDPRPSAYRGGAAGLSRPRRVRRRSVAGRCAGEEAAQPGVPARRCAPDHDDRGHAGAAGRRRVAAAAAPGHGLSLRRRQGRQRVQLHQLAVRGLRLRHPGASSPA